MADADATNPVDAVRVWVRRTPDPQGGYSIRFEVIDGKGILRVVRPGVLVDPPARPTGFEERLTAAQVGATRFLHVWEGGRRRQAHALTRLAEAQLEALPNDEWVGLAFVKEGAASVLVLPSAAESERVDDEPTWPRREMLAALQRELRELEAKSGDSGPPVEASVAPAEPVGPPPASARPPVLAPGQSTSGHLASVDAWLNTPIPSRVDARNDDERTELPLDPVRPARGSSLPIFSVPPSLPPSLPPSDVPSAAAPPHEDGDDEPIEGVMVDEAEGHGDLAELEQAAGEGSAARRGRGGKGAGKKAASRAPVRENPDRAPLTEPVTVVPFPPSPAPDLGFPSPDPSEAEGDRHAGAPPPDLHERNTTLVRFLRRRIALDRAQIRALEEQVLELQAELSRRAES